VNGVTQWEVLGSVEAISEAFLLPMLKAMLAQFPFHKSGLPFRQRQRVHQSSGSHPCTRVRGQARASGRQSQA
jgi:hypothetical protein